ncbi:hypothetical protein ACFX1Q_003982 [Malus domestica]
METLPDRPCLLRVRSGTRTGSLPVALFNASELQVLCLSSNVISGDLPDQLVSGLKGLQFLNSVEVLDLSSNLLNRTLPLDFGGENLRYLNLSYNKISGKFPVGFAKRVSENSTIFLSFNNLTGLIPNSWALLSQKTEQFAGNSELCGKPLKTLSPIPSTLSTPPNMTANTSSSLAHPMKEREKFEGGEEEDQLDVHR